MSQAAPASPPQPPAPPGNGAPGGDAREEVLPRKFGKYTLLRRLATGGMAELFLALHRSVAGFEKLVVIKRILPEMARDQNFITMLLQEARIAATFSHPNIVTIFDVGQVEKTYFIAMEHIHGEDLRSIVRSMKPKNVTEFPLEHAIAITLGVAAGLAYAHEKTDLNGKPLNIVHRDISPQNVLVTFTGDVKVVDFGIAKAAQGGEAAPEVLLAPGADDGKDREHHTKVGQLKGKVPYMSPEQARGEVLDGRSDIFALGVILFELATGRRLFRGPNEFETLKMITEGEYPRASQINPRVSPALEAVINRALAKDLPKRYQNAREMQAELEAVVRNERIAVSTLSLGTWMQMLFEEKLAAQREALLQGKQLADVIAAEEPDQFTSAGTMGGSLAGVQMAPPSKTPYVVAAAAVLLAIGASGGFYVYQKHKAAADAAERLAINSGEVEVHSTPEGASIWLNDSATPYHTPYTLRGLPTGPNAHVSLRLTAEGYAPYTQNVPMPARNAHAAVAATLDRAQANSYAVLEVTTVPGGASVLVDGRAVPGVTPLTVPQLEAGVQHTVLVRHPDTLDETFRFLGTAGAVERRPLTLHERPLAADEAWVNVATEPAGTMLRVGDRSISTGSPFHVRVHAGQVLQFAFSAPGYDGESRQVRARAGSTSSLPTVRLDRPRVGGASAPADRRPGSLRIGSSPWCNVTVDGQARGQTPVDIASISPGSHTIVCANPARGSQTQRVSVQPTQLTPVRFRFP